MNKKGSLFLSVLIIAIAIAFGFFLGLKYNNSSRDLTDLQNQLNQKNMEIANLQQQFREQINDSNNFECPIYDTIDCQLPVPNEMVGFCTGDYNNWIKENCNVNFTY